MIIIITNVRLLVSSRPGAPQLTLLSFFNTSWNLRILTGKKHRQIKLQRLQKVQIWSYWSLVHQINSVKEVIKLI